MPADIAYAEGISPVRVNGEDKILIAVDDGNTFRRKGGHYLFLDYDQLTIEEKP